MRSWCVLIFLSFKYIVNMYPVTLGKVLTTSYLRAVLYVVVLWKNDYK